jgi:hypothetical protein
LELVYLFVGKRTVHVTVVDAETVAYTTGLGMGEVIDALHCLSKVPAGCAHHLEELVLIEILWHPEGNVLVAGGKL